MKIVINSNKVIDIDDDLLIQKTSRRGEETPYLIEFINKKKKLGVNSDFLKRIECYTNIQKNINEKYETVLDLFGGVGITSKIFEKTKNESYLNDISDVCIEVLKKNYLESNISKQDSFNYNYNKKYDLIILDFNNFTWFKHSTQEKYKNIIKNVFENSNKYVLLNDSTVFAFRFGNKNYEIYSKILESPISNRQDYFRVMNNFVFHKYGYGVKQIETFNNASMLLFEKEYHGIPLYNYIQTRNTNLIRIIDDTKNLFNF